MEKQDNLSATAVSDVDDLSAAAVRTMRLAKRVHLLELGKHVNLQQNHRKLFVTAAR